MSLTASESSFVLSNKNTGRRAAFRKMTFFFSPPYPHLIVLNVKGRMIRY